MSGTIHARPGVGEKFRNKRSGVVSEVVSVVDATRMVLLRNERNQTRTKWLPHFWLDYERAEV